MLIYLLKFTVCLATLYFFYKICLENEHMHVFKRIYLLASLVAALLIPALVFTEYIEVSPLTYVPAQEYTVPQVTAGPIGIPQALEKDVLDIEPILWTVYFIGVLFFSIKFLKNLIQITKRIQKNPKQKWEEFIHVLLNDSLPPHTFLSYIFLNKQKFEAQEIPKEVLLHEQTHARQKHSYDILFVEFLQVLFWINPFIYLLKKAIKLNHEFLADEAVLNKNISKANYQNTLLSYLSEDSPHHHSPLVNPINYSSIKKRFTIMKKQTSRKAVVLRSILVLPLLAVLTYSFSETAIVPIEQAQLYDSEIPKQDIHLSDSFKKQLKELSMSKSDIYYISEGATETLMTEYNSFIKNYQETRSIQYDAYNRIVAIYHIMTEEQKQSVTKYPEIPVFNDITVTEVKPLPVDKFEAYKNEDNYAIWIDDIHVASATLNNYKVSDIVYYSESFVYKNARSEKFPQNYQVSLFTAEGFETTFKKKKVDNYNEQLRAYKEALTEFKVKNLIDDSELRIKKVQLEQLYGLLSTENIAKYNVEEIPNLPAFQMNKIQSTKVEQEEVYTIAEVIEIHINKNDQLLFRDALVSLTDLRNSLNKLNKDLNKEERQNLVVAVVYVDKETSELVIKKVTEILNDYGTATIDIKKANPTNYTKSQSEITTKELAEYNKLAKHYNSMSSNRMKIYKKDVERLEYLFSKMSKKQKATAEPVPDFPVPPPAPSAPKATHEREEALHTIETIIENQDPYDVVNGSKRVNQIEKIVVFPENTSVYIHNTKTKTKASSSIANYLDSPDLENAQFYFEGEKISTSKGLKIIKDGKIKVETFPYKNKQPEVRIYKSDSEGTIPPPPPSPGAPKVLKGTISAVPTPPSTVVLKGTTSSVPAPPEPITPLDHVIAMAKKEATFFYEGEEISSDRAINLMKVNKDLNIDSRTAKGKKPVVKLSIAPIAH